MTSVETSEDIWMLQGQNKSLRGKMRHVWNWPLVKNLQFLFYSHETWWKWLSHELIIITKFYEDGTKNFVFFIYGQSLEVSHFFPDFLFSALVLSLCAIFPSSSHFQ